MKATLKRTGMLLLFLGSFACAAQEDGLEQAPIDTAVKTETSTAPARVGSSNVMTYNILWDKATEGDKLWSRRKIGMLGLIDRHNPDILGIQEGFWNQVEYLKEELGYEYFGYGTDDGASESENSGKRQSLNPIMYNPRKWTLIEKGAFWYSDNPDSPNLGFSDARLRNCVWGKLEENAADGKTVYVFNTHFSLRDEIRQKQAAMLREKIGEIAGKEATVIVLGDFNSDPGRDESYGILSDSSHPMGLTQTNDLCSGPVVGPFFTASGFVVGSRTSGYQVDHIFVRNIRGCTTHKTITDHLGDFYPSDHFPVMTTLSF